MMTYPIFTPLPTSGKLGPIVWLLGMSGIALATYFEYMEYKYKPAGTTWTIGQAALIWVLLAGLVGLISTHFAVGSKRHLVSHFLWARAILFFAFSCE